jgi:hypothetical protein
MIRLIPLLFLAACGASPAPEFLRAHRIDTTLNGRDYTVYHTDRRVEVIRLGYARRGEHQAIRADMIALASSIPGCTLSDRSLQGDSGEMRGNIRC